MAEEVLQVKKGNPPRDVWFNTRGDTFVSKPIRFVDANDEPFDISDYDFEFEVRKSEYQNSGDPLIGNATFLLGQSDAAAAAGVAKDEVVIKIEKEHTNAVAGNWKADFRFIDATGQRETGIRVEFIQREDVSNPSPNS